MNYNMNINNNLDINARKNLGIQRRTSALHLLEGTKLDGLERASLDVDAFEANSVGLSTIRFGRLDSHGMSVQCVLWQSGTTHTHT